MPGTCWWLVIPRLHVQHDAGSECLDILLPALFSPGIRTETEDAENKTRLGLPLL